MKINFTFCIRNIETATIPNFIELISPHAFSNCINLRKIDFQVDSKIRMITKKAFNESGLKMISIPSSVTKIRNGLLS